MMLNELEAVFERVRTWPPERQRDAARLLLALEEGGNAPRLSDEQVAEVERRLHDPAPKFVTLEEVREHFARGRT